MADLEVPITLVLAQALTLALALMLALACSRELVIIEKFLCPHHLLVHKVNFFFTIW